jgi:hypothetical protein
LKFHGEVKSPLKFSVIIEKFDRGQWHTSVLNRKVDDLCASLQNPFEPWHGFFSKFKKKNCPYPAGHVEVFGKEKYPGKQDLCRDFGSSVPDSRCGNVFFAKNWIQ